LIGAPGKAWGRFGGTLFDLARVLSFHDLAFRPALAIIFANGGGRKWKNP
jgi:hypothetical protein